MRIKSFIIDCRSKDSCQWTLNWLNSRGYGQRFSAFTEYLDGNPDWFVIVVHDGGKTVNTRATIQDCRLVYVEGLYDSRDVATCPAFPSTRAFLISNRNMDISGESHTWRFA